MGVQKALRYILLFAVGFTFASLFSFYLIIRPTQFFIDRTPEGIGLPSEEVAFFGADGTRLQSWLIEPPTPTDRVVIILHGYPASRGDVLYTARDLYPDFALFLPDLRSFGESDGRYTTLGVEERRDLIAVLDLLEQRGYKKFGVFGFSLGGAVGLITSAMDQRIGAVASYASFADLRTLGHEAYKNIFVLKYPLVEFLLVYARILFGESIDDVSPIGSAEHITIPVLLIHSKEDEQISFSHGERLARALSHNKNAETYFLDRGFHGELPLEFPARLKDFFERALK